MRQLDDVTAALFCPFRASNIQEAVKPRALPWAELFGRFAAATSATHLCHGWRTLRLDRSVSHFIAVSHWRGFARLKASREEDSAKSVWFVEFASFKRMTISDSSNESRWLHSPR
jgi:hypothetical protein